LALLAKRDSQIRDQYWTNTMQLCIHAHGIEAITALESAIERQPGRRDFHDGIVALYEATGNLPMAEQHRAVSKRIAEIESQAQAEAAETESTPVETAPAPTP
jgi:hypothetical protein